MGEDLHICTIIHILPWRYKHSFIFNGILLSLRRGHYLFGQSRWPIITRLSSLSSELKVWSVWPWLQHYYSMIKRNNRSVSFSQRRNIHLCPRRTWVIIGTPFKFHRHCYSGYKPNMVVSAEAALDFLSFVNASPTRMFLKRRLAILVFTKS